MTAERRIWQVDELEGHLDELFQRAATGEAQEVRDGAGRAFTVQLQPAGSGFVSALKSDLRSGLSVYDESLRGDDFQPERLSGPLRDIDL